MTIAPNKQESFNFNRLLCPIVRPFIDIKIGNIIERAIEIDEKEELERLGNLLSGIEADPCLSLRQTELVEQWRDIIHKKMSHAKEISTFRSNFQ